MSDPPAHHDDEPAVTSRFAPLWQLTLARWRGFFREPSALFWTFGFPLLLALALGLAFRNRPPERAEVAVELGHAESETTRAALARSSELHVLALAPAEARAALRTGRVALVVVPAEATRADPPAVTGPPRAALPAEAPALTYRFDPTRPESRLARLLVDDALQRAAGRADVRRAVDSRVTAVGSRYIDFLIPGLLGMNLLSSGLWGIGFTLVEMRTRKLIKRLVATPMRRSDFLLAFVAMRAVFVLLELPVLVGFAWLVFGVPVRGSLVLLTLLALLGAMVFAAMGLLVASRAENTQSIGGLTNLVTLPMFLFSGVFFSAERFPAAMQPAIHALPLTALNNALRAVMLDGAGPAAVVGPVAVLLAWGVASLAGALALFRWR